MATSDPLLLLRSALSSSSKVTLLLSQPAGSSTSTFEEVYTLPACTHIQLSSARLTFPKDTPTRYTSQNGGDTFYDLETLLFAFLARDDSTVDYMKKVRELGQGQAKAFVSVTERKVVVDWLSGKTPIEGPEGRIQPLAGSAAANAPSSPSKRPATEHDLRPGESAPGDENVPIGSTSAVFSEGTVPGTATATIPTLGKRARFVPDKADQDKVKHLIALMEGPSYAEGSEKHTGTLKSRDTVLRGERTNNFDSVRISLQNRLKILRDEIHPPSSSSHHHPAATAPSSSASSVSGSSSKSGSGSSGGQKKRHKDPIIIISPSSTALVTMHNVKRFLEESVFESSAEVLKRLTADGITRQVEDVVPIYHLRPPSASASSSSAGGLGSSISLAGSANAVGKKQRFLVVDGVEALSKFGGTDDAWDRVVCVMTTGQEWQFRPYKWREPKELFHHVKGIHFQWTTDAVNTKVRSWNVSELRIDPTKRHIDKSVVTDFWRTLDTYIALNKPALLN